MVHVQKKKKKSITRVFSVSVCQNPDIWKNVSLKYVLWKDIINMDPKLGQLCAFISI